MAGDFLGLAKNGIEALGAKGTAEDIRYLTQTEILANRCGSVVIAKKYDFGVRMEQLPTLQRIPLNDIDMSLKRLGRGEQRKH